MSFPYRPYRTLVIDGLAFVVGGHAHIFGGIDGFAKLHENVAGFDQVLTECRDETAMRFYFKEMWGDLQERSTGRIEHRVIRSIAGAFGIACTQQQISLA
jgi:hypothetical protein